MEKLTELYSLRVTESLKAHLDKLPHEWKAKANEAARIAMARVIHDYKFDPTDYIGGDE